MKAAALVAAAVLAAGADAAAKRDGSYGKLAYSPPVYPSPWMDPHATGWEEAYAKAREFVGKMTLLEKVNITTGVGWEGDLCVGNVGSVPRLGLRGLCMQDGPLGSRDNDYNSAYGGGVTAASSWSRQLWSDRGKNIGAENHGKGIDVSLGPVAGPIGRSPEGGRNWEGFSPDPYLTGTAFSDVIVGIQDSGVIACAKHFIGNEQEHFRQQGEAVGYGFDIDEALSSNIDDKTLHELYVWPFADAVKAGVGAVMCSYNQVNNSYGCQNSKTINGILKGELGFQGFVMSDWQAQHAGVSTAAAGLDMTMPGDTMFNTGLSYWGANLTLAVINGTVPEWRIDDMATRIMASFFKVGRTVESEPDINFSSWTRASDGFKDTAAMEFPERVNYQVDVRGNHAEHIREAGAKGSVLLKNTKGALPLHKPKFVVAVGEDATSNPLGPNGCSDRGCVDNGKLLELGTLAMGWGSGTANFPYLVTPDSALQEQALVDGTRYESVLSNFEWADTEALVTQPDVTAIVFANADSGEGYINVDGNEGDRKNLTLWKGADELIKNVASVNPNTIVVMHTVGPVLVSDWHNNPNITAIVWAGLPGQESGHSLVDLLYGKVSPGRSVFTWGPNRKSYGTDVLYKPNNGKGAPQVDFSEGVFIDYRHFDKYAPPGHANAPIYEFGYGLSWSTFKYSNLKVTKHNVRPYQPTKGKTIAAPSGPPVSKNLKDYVFPEGIRYIHEFIYPWLNTSSSGKAASGDPRYGEPASKFLPHGATDGSPQPKAPASGAPGGNPQLWDVMYTVSATITNTGKATTDEVPQLYVSLGGPDEPVRVLRGFDRLEGIRPGQSVTFTADLTRRDLSNWDTSCQDWLVTSHAKTVWVGSSSRNLPLSAQLH